MEVWFVEIKAGDLTCRTYFLFYPKIKNGRYIARDLHKYPIIGRLLKNTLIADDDYVDVSVHRKDCWFAILEDINGMDVLNIKQIFEDVNDAIKYHLEMNKPNTYIYPLEIKRKELIDPLDICVSRNECIIPKLDVLVIAKEMFPGDYDNITSDDITIDDKKQILKRILKTDEFKYFEIMMEYSRQRAISHLLSMLRVIYEKILITNDIELKKKLFRKFTGVIWRRGYIASWIRLEIEEMVNKIINSIDDEDTIKYMKKEYEDAKSWKD